MTIHVFIHPETTLIHLGNDTFADHVMFAAHTCTCWWILGPNKDGNDNNAQVHISNYWLAAVSVTEGLLCTETECHRFWRVINEWNRLPNDCVNASSVNMFKNRIDRYLIRAGYT